MYQLQQVVFYDWLLSFSTMVVFGFLECVLYCLTFYGQIVFCCMDRQTTFCLTFVQLITIWIVLVFGSYDECCCDHPCFQTDTFFCGFTHRCRIARSYDHVEQFEELANCFSEVAAPLYILINIQRRFLVFCVLTHLLALFHYSCPGGHTLAFVVLTHISLTDNAAYLFMCLLFIFIYLQKCLFTLFSHLLTVYFLTKELRVLYCEFKLLTRYVICK